MSAELIEETGQETAEKLIEADHSLFVLLPKQARWLISPNRAPDG